MESEYWDRSSFLAQHLIIELSRYRKQKLERTPGEKEKEKEERKRGRKKEGREWGRGGGEGNTQPP